MAPALGISLFWVLLKQIWNILLEWHWWVMQGVQSRLSTLRFHCWWNRKVQFWCHSRYTTERFLNYSQSNPAFFLFLRWCSLSQTVCQFCCKYFYAWSSLPFSFTFSLSQIFGVVAVKHACDFTEFKRKKASSSSELKQWWESNIAMLNPQRLTDEGVRNSLMCCVGTVLMTDIFCSVASLELWTRSKAWRLWSTCCCVASGFVFITVLGVWLCRISTSSYFLYFPCLS